MSDFTYERLKENLERLKMKNTLEILDNYLEQALKDKVNVVEILDHIFSEEAKSKNRRAVEKLSHSRKNRQKKSGKNGMNRSIS